MEPDASVPGWLRTRELSAELELERRLRKKAESLNKTLAGALGEERRRSESMERELHDLSEENSRLKADMDRLRAEVAEERKMMRVAEVLREERVRMKLLDAGLLMEEKLLQFSKSKLMVAAENDGEEKGKRDAEGHPGAETASSNGELHPWDRSGRGFDVTEKSNTHLPKQQQQKKKQVENPHIRRGNIGYVEFPTTLVRSRSSGSVGGFLAGATRGGKVEMGPKLERQNGRLRVLLMPNSRVKPLGN